MNENEMRSVIRDLTEQKAPAAHIDLWPAILPRVQMSQSISSRGTMMNPQSHSPSTQRRQGMPALILASLLLIGALFLLLPQGRALAQQVMHFFYQGEDNLMPGVTITPVRWVEQTPGVAAATATPAAPRPTQAAPAFAAACGSYNAPHCTIEAIRSMVDFPVFALAQLPDGMEFAGATGAAEHVQLLYLAADQSAFLLIQEEPYSATQSLPLALEVGADAHIQTVQVGNAQAEYVRGSYDGNRNPPVWNSDLALQQLRWVDQGILFSLSTSSAGESLSRDQLAALAATLTDSPLSEGAAALAATATPAAEISTDLQAAYPLTLAEAEEKAGVTLLWPSRLPEPLTFVGANYDEQTRVVELLFHYNQPNYPQATDGLVVREQLAPEGADCDLCGFVQGNGEQVEQYPIGKLVSQDAHIETIQIGDLSGQYLEGIGWTSATACCGWQWDSTPYTKRLRFQTHGLAIDVTAYTFELNQADLITIAESLQ